VRRAAPTKRGYPGARADQNRLLGGLGMKAASPSPLSCVRRRPTVVRIRRPKAVDPAVPLPPPAPAAAQSGREARPATAPREHWRPMPASATLCPHPPPLTPHPSPLQTNLHINMCKFVEPPGFSVVIQPFFYTAENTEKYLVPLWLPPIPEPAGVAQASLNKRLMELENRPSRRRGFRRLLGLCGRLGWDPGLICGVLG
jgi:hypothetical protein